MMTILTIKTSASSCSKNLRLSFMETYAGWPKNNATIENPH